MLTISARIRCEFVCILGMTEPGKLSFNAYIRCVLVCILLTGETRAGKAYLQRRQRS